VKRFAIALGIIGVLIGGFFLLSSPDNGKSNDATVAGASTTAQPKTFSQIQQAVADGGRLLDVRTPEEYAAGHIEEATNFPLQDLQAGTMPGTDKKQTIFVYCHSGNRSGQATTILKNAGYTNIVDLGAMTHVQSLGGKVVKS